MDFTALQCPIPISEYPSVTMAHGGGGRLTQMLIERMFVPAFSNPSLEALHDGAILPLPFPSPARTGEGEERGSPIGTAEGWGEGSRLAFTTDSFVITPRFFPGGDIGSLSVHGTVNDLAMCGARPLALSAGFLLEEGLPMEELWRIVQSMQRAAQSAGVAIVTGDTKVVDRGRGDGIYINTTGLGIIPPGIDISPRRARPGDRIIINGPIAMHGIAVMSVREGLQFETALESDAASLHTLVARILNVGGSAIHVLRDPTRGGVASALNEIAAQAQVGIRLWEASIPIGDAVRGACEILGLDPLYVANEGKCLVIAAPEAAEAVLGAMRADPLGAEAAIIGEVVASGRTAGEGPRVEQAGRVTIRSRIGGWRIVDTLSGEQLPRIC
jgi:hydrogenase expression/formation protein HypE